MKYSLIDRAVVIVYIFCIVSLLCLWGWADKQFKDISEQKSVTYVKPQIEKISDITVIEKDPPDIIEEDEDEIIEEVEDMTCVSVVPTPTLTPTPMPTKQVTQVSSQSLSVQPITESLGRVQGPVEVETYYNLPMDRVIQNMRNMGYTEDNYPHYVREDGVKMLGDFVMVATNIEKYPKGTIVQTSLGQGIVCDKHEVQDDSIDIAVEW